MTACCCYSEIKSSVYNQTGEGFFKQLAAYNHMSAHLRRVLLAKSRVDSRNPNYLRRRRTMSTGRAKFTEKTASQELIDQLAYDTEHHPMEIVRMRYSLDSRLTNRSKKCPVSCNNFLIDCPATHLNPLTSRLTESDRNHFSSRSRPRGSGLSFHSARPGTLKKNYANQRHQKEEIIPSHHTESACSSPRSVKNKDDNDQIDYNYASSFESPSDISRRGSIASKGSVSSQSYSESIFTEKNKEKQENSPSKLSEEAKYSKFLYDITQEIVQNGLYKDEELKEVFKRHIKRNSHTLDRNKMMYELYQLKLSLNLIDHDDDDDDDEEETIERFLHSRKYSVVKPPTPPKVLDENKLVDKLMNPEDLKATYSKSPHSGRHTVVLVDANPELLVTERDILATLMEMNIGPQQAHDVYKRLQKKSKDLHPLQMKNRLDYVVFRKRTVGQVQGEKIDRAISPISSGHKLKSRKKLRRTDQHHPNYSEMLEKSFSIDYPVYLDHLPDYYSRTSKCICQRNSQNLFYNVCHCQRRLPVRLLYCPGVSPSRSSIKSRSSNEKKIIDADKKVKNPEITGPKCFCSTRVTPKKNLLGSSQIKKDTDMKDKEKIKKYVEIIKVKPDNKILDKKINDSKLKIKSSKSLDALSRKSTESSALKSLPKKEIQKKDKDNVKKIADSRSSKSSQLSSIDRKNSEISKTSDKISSDTKKSSSPGIKSSIMKDSSKSPKVLKEIKPQLSDESEESIVESYSEVESTVGENLTHSTHEVDTEKSESKHSSISNEDGNEQKDSDGDESVEEIDNVNENVDI